MSFQRHKNPFQTAWFKQSGLEPLEKKDAMSNRKKRNWLDLCKTKSKMQLKMVPVGSFDIPSDRTH
jgi:hypothetical protein